jgi:D-alanyl-D-alanine carboxypeptidase
MLKSFRLSFSIVMLSVASATAQVDSVAYLMGKFDPTRHPDFVEVPTSMASREGMFLRKEVLEAFTKMREAAAKDGVQLRVISATRSFQHQKGIWEGKWNGSRKVNGRSLNVAIPDPADRAREILRYSSMPGTSRHHWGTDFDINSLSPSHFSAGEGKRAYEWLRDNAHGFGFCQSYTAKGDARPHGYEEEAWHWSYFPVSCLLLRQYKRLVKAEDVSGFQGSNALPFTEILRYVDGVAPECR